MWHANSEGGHWLVHFRRDLRDWESLMLEDLLTKIGDCTFSENEDSWVWIWSRKGRFTVKSMYKHLIDEKFTRIGNRVVFPSGLVWGMELPMNIKLFFWSLFLGKTLTRQNLVNRGLEISTCCPLCNLLPESVEHLFLHFPLVLELWFDLLRSKQHLLIKLYEADFVRTWFSQWPTTSGNGLLVRVWSYLPYAVAWITLKSRNNKVFNEGVPQLRRWRCHGIGAAIGLAGTASVSGTWC
ncbi:hypothetical protein FRX31_002798 [Thalictrum thalictroides]|uniref:Reverse transcriptase zinc-binding domain-containing protein n=1 Tax=Thalictrum thalictroides TaxID=46969 RepID=A0A7J6XDQ6_THATH|nr:hypothetical protein FRX31_002798 [Thalictrum thalictroides]